MALTGQEKTVSLTNANTLQVTVTATGLTNIYKRTNIVSIEPVKIQDYAGRENAAQNNVQYRYSKQVAVKIYLIDGRVLDLELQDITNQATWLPTLAGQQQCITDFLAWL